MSITNQPEKYCFRRYIGWVFLLLVARGAILPYLPLTDPTEGRYAVIAKEMVVSGDWVTPRLWIEGQNVPFLGKPPLYFWCSAGCMKLFGINEFSARLPGVLSFAITLLIVWTVLRRYTSEEIAWRAVFLLLSSAVLFIYCGVVIVDMMVTMTATGALFGYYAFTRETNLNVRKRWSVLVFVMLGLGFMTKGPVAIVLFGLPVLLWTLWFHRWKEILHQEWYWGITLFALITIPWFILAEEKNPGFARYFFINENFLRFIIHDYGDKYGSGHEHIRGAAIWMMMLASAPWSFYILYRLLQERKHLPLKQSFLYEEAVFFLSIFIANTLFWVMARQLLMTYLFPLVPGFTAWLAILVSRTPRLRLANDPIFKKISLIISVCLIIGIAASAPILSAYSTKNIIEKAHALSGSEKYALYFVRRIPYSAYFYGGTNVIAHPTEPIEESMSYSLNNTGSFYIADKKYWTELPDSYRQKVSILSNEKKYILFVLRQKTNDITK